MINNKIVHKLVHKNILYCTCYLSSLHSYSFNNNFENDRNKIKVKQSSPLRKTSYCKCSLLNTFEIMKNSFKFNKVK